MEITGIKGIEIFDSRGSLTLEVHLKLSGGQLVIASVPTGAFTSKYEAVAAKDIQAAVRNVNGIIAKSIIGQDPINQKQIDSILISLDGTSNKEQLGANTLLGVSIAAARAGSVAINKTLALHLRDTFEFQPSNPNPTPMFNVVNGGAHADNNLSFQEFMVVPLNNSLTFREKMLQGKKVFDILKKRLDDNGKSTNVGDEGGFAPEYDSNDEAIEILVEAIQEAGFTPGQDMGIAIDIAAGGIPDLNIATYPKNPLDYYNYICSEYPIIALEDPFTDDAWQDWANLTSAIGGRVQIIGDDLFTTNVERLKLGIRNKAANAISIKPNQIGTVTETVETIKLALQNNISFQISHRSGETEDTFISDLAIASNAAYFKAGAPNRGERIAKYNQIIRLEEL